MTEPTNRPARLFRYFSPVHSHIFTGKKLWFSTAEDFNDIFEAFPRFDQLIPVMADEALKRNYAFLPPEIKVSFQDYKKAMLELCRKTTEECNEEYPENFQMKFSRFYGIVCFTEHLDSLLMWGHYTHCHRGFVIEFDPQHSIFTPRDFGKVIYGVERPVVTKEANSQILLCKSSEWAYEDEHRLIKVKSELTQETYDRNGVPTKGYFLPLPMDSIKAVYFGCRISTEHRNNLLKPLEAYPDVKKFFMRRSPGMIPHAIQSIKHGVFTHVA